MSLNIKQLPIIASDFKVLLKTESLNRYSSHYEIKCVLVKFVHAFFRATTRKIKSASCKSFII